MSGKHYSPVHQPGFGDPRCGANLPENQGRERRAGFPPVPAQSHLLSFAEAKAAGEAMFDHCLGAHEQDHECPAPPFERVDAGWADMARAAWEAVWAGRR